MEVKITKNFNEKEVVRENLPSLLNFVEKTIQNSTVDIMKELKVDRLEEYDDYMSIRMELAIQTLDAIQEFIDEYRHNIGELIEKIDIMNAYR